MANKNEEKKELAKLIGATFGSFLGARVATDKLGSKVNEKYGQAIVGGGILAGSVMVSDKISKTQPSIALGLVAGTGANALFMLMKTEPIRTRLPDAMQSMLSGASDRDYIPVVSLNGVSDEELYGNERVREIAHQMADDEVNETLAALNGAAEQLALPNPDETDYEVSGNEETEVSDHSHDLNGDYEINGGYEVSGKKKIDF